MAEELTQKLYKLNEINWGMIKNFNVDNIKVILSTLKESIKLIKDKLSEIKIPEKQKLEKTNIEDIYKNITQVQKNFYRGNEEKIKNISYDGNSNNYSLPLYESEDKLYNNYNNIFHLFSLLIDNINNISDTKKNTKQINIVIIDNIKLFTEKCAELSESIDNINKIMNEYIDKKIELFNVEKSDKYDFKDIKLVDNPDKIEKYTYKYSYNFFTEVVKKNSLEEFKIFLKKIVDFNNTLILLENIKFNKANSKENNKIDEIIELDFSSIINEKMKMTIEEVQSGGNNHIRQLSKIIKKLRPVLITYYNLNKKVEEYIKVKNKYNKKKNDINTFIIYCFSIYLKSSATYRKSPIFLYYKYINKGLIVFYDRIVSDILLKLQNINEAPKKIKKILIYFNTYHKLLLEEINLFLKFLLENKDFQTESVIDIFNCSGKIKKMFSLLNEFKTLLEAYNEYAQKNVTIYGRINDWGITFKKYLEGERIFYSDKTNYSIMRINKNYCESVKKNYNINSNISEIKFTEVFDSELFTKNIVISKYMALETQINKGKGLMMLTYGYSGTGKTVTLFGKKAEKKDTEPIEGVLQSTLTNIKDMEKILFRVYEIYGRGVQEKSYWESESGSIKLNHQLIEHNLSIDNYLIKINSEKSSLLNNDTIKKYLMTNNYIEIDKKSAPHVLNNFSSFIEKLDEKRKEKGRITSTPNNPESSRSIIVYDMLVYVKTGEKITEKKKEAIYNYIPFIIIDLPGREEISETYSDTYLQKWFLYEDNNGANIINETNKYIYNYFLSSLTVNPLGLSVLCPDKIFDFCNNNLSEQIINKISNDVVAKAGTKNNFVSDYININRNNKIHLEPIKKCDKEDNTDIMNKLGTPYKTASNNKKISIVGSGNDINISKQTSACLHFLKYIIQSKNMDLMHKLIEHCASIFINQKLTDWIKSNLKENNEKIKFLICQYYNHSLSPKEIFTDATKSEMYTTIFEKEEKYENEITNSDNQSFLDILYKIKKIVDNGNLDKDIENKVLFQYYSTPLEGVYINESINQLIRYLSLKVNSEDEVNRIIKQQTDDVSFESIKKYIRNNMRRGGIYVKNPKNPESDTDLAFAFCDYENSNEDLIYRKISGWNSMTEKNKKNYDSSKIYIPINNIMTNLLNHYNNIEENSKKNTIYNNIFKESKNINDFKVFYLLSNTLPELKCDHQINLLDKTKSFIKAIQN